MKRTTQFFFTLTGQYNALTLTRSKASRDVPSRVRVLGRVFIKTLLGRVRIGY